jgi:hypothetical protein
MMLRDVCFYSYAGRLTERHLADGLAAAPPTTRPHVFARALRDRIRQLV